MLKQESVPPLKKAESILVSRKAESVSAVVPAKASESILPPTLRQKSVETKKLVRNINNNDVWTNANDKVYRNRITSLPVVPLK